METRGWKQGNKKMSKHSTLDTQQIRLLCISRCSGGKAVHAMQRTRRRVTV